MDIDAVIKDRFGQWVKRFRKERAAPMLTLGVNPSNGTLVIAVPEGVTHAEIREALLAALTVIDQGNAEYVEEPEARGDLHR